MVKVRHFCNQVTDPGRCCIIGGHMPQPIDEGFDHPDCIYPPAWKARYCADEGIPIPDNTCGSCWSNASGCSCPEPRVVFNPSERVSYSCAYSARYLPGTSTMVFRRILPPDSVV